MRPVSKGIYPSETVERPEAARVSAVGGRARAWIRRELHGGELGAAVEDGWIPLL